jgi:hypothetical protein
VRQHRSELPTSSWRTEPGRDLRSSCRCPRANQRRESVDPARPCYPYMMQRGSGLPSTPSPQSLAHHRDRVREYPGVSGSAVRGRRGRQLRPYLGARGWPWSIAVDRGRREHHLRADFGLFARANFSPKYDLRRGSACTAASGHRLLQHGYDVPQSVRYVLLFALC